MTTFFTADSHFGHAKLAEYRGFDTVQSMNDALIAAWNSVVPATRSAEVYHLGDFSFMGTTKTLEVLEALNGRIFLIPGNHDKGMSTAVRNSFEGVKKPIHELDVEWGDKSQRLVLCHFPMLVWNRAHHGAIHLHGHSHGNLRFPNPSARIMDVGVDANEALMPVSLSRVMEHMIGADHKPFDQHGTL